MPDQVSIKQLPEVTEINTGDLLLVQTPNATNTLSFENFIIGLDNTTFSSTISSNTTNIKTISGILFETPTATNTAYTAANIRGLPITIGGVNFNIMLSAI